MGDYQPMMSPERAERLRQWHETALEGGKRDQPASIDILGSTLVVPPGVYLPNPLGLAEIVADDVRPGDRMLDMGTGSGVNGIVAAVRGATVVGVDVNPEAVECANRNASRNGVTERFHAETGDLFGPVSGRFSLIAFDPPFRWFRPRTMVERAMADENYSSLRAFFRELDNFLSDDGRVLISFGNTGDLDYLDFLVDASEFQREEVRRVEGEKDGLPIAYVAYRLTRK